MLEQAMKAQVSTYFENLKSTFTLKVAIREDHPSKADLLSLLEDVQDCSEKISLEVATGNSLELRVLQNDEDTRISFQAVPTGHEFTTLLLAILNLDGIGKNLPDATTLQRIKSVKQPVTIKSYISLSCTNCPDVVQALNLIAFNNPNVQHEIIDGGINKEQVEALNIQSVPSVYIGDELFHVGRSNMGELVGKLEEFTGAEFSLADTEPQGYDVVVVGAGPAGVSSAIYSARKGFKVAIVAQTMGGQVSETTDIENLISVNKTNGTELTANLLAHAKDYDIDILDNRMVKSVEVKEGVKYLTTSLGETIFAPALIAATGASWRKLGVPGEDKFIGSGVAFCTHCDAPFFKDKKVVVVGGGNSGLEAAIDLSSIAAEVTVLEFLDELKGDKVLQDKLAEKPNVKVILNAQTLEVKGDTKVNGLQYRNREDESVHDLDIDGVFVQIGLSPNSTVFKDVVETSRMGEIVIDANCRTNVPGIYAAGDVSVVPYKQIVIAMGEGAKASLSAFEDEMKGKLLHA